MAAGQAPVSSWRNGVYVPQMPWFEPSSEPSAKASLLAQTVREGDHFTFPADASFWNNFVTQARLYPGAMEQPHFHVDASHTDESLLVNQEFLRRFVSGWERANPHVVKVITPQGSTTFHSSDEFWNRFVTMAGQRSRERAARGELVTEDTVVQSSMYPGMPPVRTTQRDWLDICQSWEAERALQNQSRSRNMVEEPLISQQNITLDAQRNELANKLEQIAAHRRQVDQLRAQLAEAQGRAQTLQSRNSSADSELSAARQEAEARRQEMEDLRRRQQQMQQAWESERASLEQRLLSTEQSLGQLQGDVGRQREQMRRDLAARERQLQEATQEAQIADLRKELQLREQMQEELCRAREEAVREAEEVARDDAMRRTQQELDELKQYLREQPLCPPRLVCMPSTSSDHSRRAGGSPYQRTLLVRCPQRTVATQTPPRARDLVVMAPASAGPPVFPGVSPSRPPQPSLLGSVPPLPPPPPFAVAGPGPCGASPMMTPKLVGP
eukprot:TRINITY_DN13179_c0_g1_i1.p1 TRINITY_DN13179_c0_g1~~TRINITY_DN13179_c0_g1_i1.p1  ORF type:complete len:499 (+),score=146.97 TRINITY_DN13179_c0_g1_i1:57-1553(+)